MSRLEVSRKELRYLLSRATGRQASNEIPLLTLRMINRIELEGSKATLAPKRIGFGNTALRGLWHVCWLLLYRPTPTFMHFWRRILLRLFGATIEQGAHPYPSARIWAPWNLVMRRNSCIASNVDCYCVDRIELGADSTVSQYSYLCSASRDITKGRMNLVSGPITIGEGAWIAADVFVGPGVTIGRHAVVGARSSVFADIPPDMVAHGSPARVVRSRPQT